MSIIAGFAGNSGTNDGTGGNARFNGPHGIAVDNVGNLFVTDSGNHTIRKITAGGVVITFAGLAGSIGSANGPGSNARFGAPSGITVDVAGNVYVAEQLNHTIRKITTSGMVSTVAGLAGDQGSADGMASSARFRGPTGITVDNATNLYVAEQGNHTIRKIAADGIVSTLAGLAGNPGNSNGSNSNARFSGPSGISVASGGDLYVADRFNTTIRKITTNGVASTFAGAPGNFGSSDGTGGAARFSNPHGIAVDSADNIYVVDFGNGTIRKITVAAVVSTLAGFPPNTSSADGTGGNARFVYPTDVTADGAGNLYVTDRDNHTIRKITAA